MKVLVGQWGGEGEGDGGALIKRVLILRYSCKWRIKSKIFMSYGVVL